MENLFFAVGVVLAALVYPLVVTVRAWGREF